MREPGSALRMHDEDLELESVALYLSHLTDQHRDSFLRKQPHGTSIPIQIPRSESLVSRIKERIMFLFQKSLEDLVPLFGGRVDSLYGWSLV
jgi:hypothetical protein